MSLTRQVWIVPKLVPEAQYQRERERNRLKLVRNLADLAEA
jgi:hypothetical protein